MIEKLFKKAQGKSKSTFKEAEIKVQFGRPVVKTFADNNKKQLTRSKSRRVASDVGVAIPAQKREAIQREKDDKKQTIKAKIESKVSPSKLQAKGKREGGRETSLNREIQHAMNKMAQVMQVAFRERANE